VKLLKRFCKRPGFSFGSERETRCRFVYNLRRGFKRGCPRLSSIEVISDRLAIRKKVEEAVSRIHAVGSKHTAPSFEASSRFEEEVMIVADEWDRLLVEETGRLEREEPCFSRWAVAVAYIPTSRS